MDLATIDKKLTTVEALLNANQAKLAQLKTTYAAAINWAGAAEAAQVKVQDIATDCQGATIGVMLTTVNHALAATFGPDVYKVDARAKAARGGTEVQILLVDPISGLEISDPLDASAGGVVDVAAFALRVASIALAQPPIRRLLIADEPLKFLSVEYRALAAGIISSLATDLNFQIIMVTHIPELHIGTVLTVG